MMRKLAPSYIDCIEIPDIKNGITSKNAAYFDFPDSAYQLLGKRGMQILCVEVVLFILWITLRKGTQGLLFWGLTGLLLVLAVFYEHEYRPVRIYKKAKKGAASLAADYTLKKIDKLVQNKRIFFRDMPGVYYILKTKALLQEGDFVGAELLMDQLTLPESNGIRYIRALCAYLAEKDEAALKLLTAIVQSKSAGATLRKRSQELCSILHADIPAPSDVTGPENH